MNGSTFNQLTIFQAIAAEGSISAAARKLEMATPSVSNALKALEAEIGLPLFTRTTRRIELTEAGQQLASRIEAPINELKLAVESVSDLGHSPSGKVRITAPRFVFQSLLKPVYAEFCRLYPDIELEISVSDAAVDILAEGFDLGIRFGALIEEGMVARELTPPMKDALFASADYVQEYGLPRSPDELKQHKLIKYRFISSNQFAPLYLHQNGAQLTIEMPTAVVVNDTDFMIDAARKGLGIGKLIEPLVNTAFDDGSLLPVLPEYWHSVSGLYLYFHRNTQKAMRVRVLIDFLLERLKFN